MATDAVSWVALLLIGFLLIPDIISEVKGWSIYNETSAHRIQVVDNDPEFLVGATGIEKPFCFHLESPKNDVIRLLQDPVTSVVVNARVFHEQHSNKSYLGTILVGGDDVRVLAKQDLVMINDRNYEWLGMKALDVKGHRVVVGANMVAVTFRGKRITLIVRRHFINKANPDGMHRHQHHDHHHQQHNSGEVNGGTLHNHNVNNSTTQDQSNNNENDGDGNENIVPYNNKERGDSPPTVPIRRRRELVGGESSQLHQILMHKKVQGQNIKVVLPISPGGEQSSPQRSSEDLFSKRDNQGKPGDNNKHNIMMGTGLSKRAVTHINTWTNLQRNKQRDREREREMENERLRRHRKRQQQFRPEYGDQDRVRGVTSDQRQNHVIVSDLDEPMTADGLSGTIYLGVYISDSRDFSNQTHGLLGQFLFKNVTMEKMKIKKGKVKAHFIIDQDPNRRTIALLSVRRNVALNTSRACWRVRHQGRDVIDGKYEDYVVPNMRYTLMRRLPPHTAL